MSQKGIPENRERFIGVADVKEPVWVWVVQDQSPQDPGKSGFPGPVTDSDITILTNPAGSGGSTTMVMSKGNYVTRTPYRVGPMKEDWLAKQAIISTSGQNEK